MRLTCRLTRNLHAVFLFLTQIIYLSSEKEKKVKFLFWELNNCRKIREKNLCLSGEFRSVFESCMKLDKDFLNK